MLVPVRLRYGLFAVLTVPFSRKAAFDVYIQLPGTASETIPVPVATTSGFARKSTAVGPRELYPAILSSIRVIVPSWLYAPTVSTQGALPGAVMPPYCALPVVGFFPMFPAAVTTTMPASTQRLVASVSG